MAAERLGLFVMIDGLDGVGKGVILESLRDYVMQKLGKSVFDLEDYWGKKGFHPEFSDFAVNDVVMSSEPTFIGVGKTIREEMIARHSGRSYSARAVASAYSLDRMVLYQRVLLPALQFGKWVLQSRGVPTSLAYQPIQAEMQKNSLSVEDVMSLEGNVLALSNAPDLLIIPTISDVDALAKRLAVRGKQDNAIFENTLFQSKLKPIYESKWFKEIFESRGTVVNYFDAGVSVEHSRSEAVRVLEEFLKSRGKIQ